MTTTTENHELVELVQEFLKTYYGDEIAELAQHYPNERRSLIIDWSDLLQYDPDVADDYHYQPEQIQPYFEEALRLYDLSVDVALGQAHVRLHNIGEPLRVTDLRAKHVNTLVTINGQVSKVTPIRPKLRKAAFECQRCGTLTRIPQGGDDLQDPNQCPGCEKQGLLRINFSQSEFIDHQQIRVTMPPEEPSGSDEWLDVHLADDAVNSVEPGQRAEITAVIQMKEHNGSTVFDLYGECHTAIPHDSDYESIEIDEHREQFEALANGEQGDPFDLLIDSISPTITGGEKMENIKLAIALQQFSGWSRPHPDGQRARGDSHICLIGDPGTGKSSLIETVLDINPRSAFTSGKNTTAAGLTAAAVSDDFGDSDWSLEAGVLVKADGGIACIDEIDKVHGEALKSLHTALERQSIGVSKAGMNADLPCRTALLAAGNPKYGRFDQNEPIIQQLDLEPALMSRFDLVFTLVDQPDPDRDEAMAEHIVKARNISGRIARGDLDADAAEADLIDPAISKETLRAWIAHARENYRPVIENENVREALVKYFAEIRSSTEGKTVPLTARKLTAVQRFAEASARVRLSDTIEMQDVEIAKRVIGASLGDVGINADGHLDGDTTEIGYSQSQQEKRKALIKLFDAADPDEVLTPAEVKKRTMLDCPPEEIRIHLNNLTQQRGTNIVPEDDGYRGV